MSKKTFWSCDNCGQNLNDIEKELKFKIVNNATVEYFAFNLCMQCIQKLPAICEALTRRGR